MKIILRRLLGLRAFAFAFLTLLALPQSARAAASETYVFEGFHFDAADRARIGAADDRLQRGVDALKRSDWATAERECAAAYNEFIAVRLPEIGLGKEAYQWARACVADSHAARGNWEPACRGYRNSGYFSLRVGNPRQMCAQYGAAEEAALTTHSEYAASFKTFANRLIRLNELPGGSGRTALAQELNSDCAKLRGFGQRVPPAPAAAGYCAGIVAFEQGRSGEACRTMWTSASSIRTALRGQLLQEQRNHGVELQAMLDTFRPICADMGYTWPEFGGLWPH